ncbi:hypothetical protein EB837_02530 [Kluyvera ascorbata]|uniref:Uncharacterized protein n=1 Tax=Kluyvera ascorbata TaxID=51288 RepID=A0A3N2SDC6_9ENTR|nr:hypothetical protein EB837_02530 [Kluyvera ascorbata]
MLYRRCWPDKRSAIRPTFSRYALPYSIPIAIISLQYIDMRNPYFRRIFKQVCWSSTPNFIQLRIGHE